MSDKSPEESSTVNLSHLKHRQICHQIEGKLGKHDSRQGRCLRHRERHIKLSNICKCATISYLFWVKHLIYDMWNNIMSYFSSQRDALTETIREEEKTFQKVSMQRIRIHWSMPMRKSRTQPSHDSRTTCNVANGLVGG